MDLRNSGFAVDDNNEPVPENMHVATTVYTVADTVIDRNSIAVEDWEFDDMNFYVASQNVTITAEGPLESLF